MWVLVGLDAAIACSALTVETSQDVDCRSQSPSSCRQEMQQPVLNRADVTQSGSLMEERGRLLVARFGQEAGSAPQKCNS